MAINVLKQDDAEGNVFNYEPKSFPVVVSEPANNFISSQAEPGTVSDFKINELISEQAGISKKKKEQVEQQIKEEALEKLKETQELAYKEAYDLGLIEGAEKAFQDNISVFEERLSYLEKMLKNFESLSLQLLAQKENQLVKLMYEIAKKIALFEIKNHPENIEKVILNMVDEMQSSERVLIRLSKQDYDFINRLKDKTGRKADAYKRVKLEPDDGMTSGGCVLETNFTMVDASVEQRVEKVWSIIKEKMPRVDVKTNLETFPVNEESDFSEEELTGDLLDVVEAKPSDKLVGEKEDENIEAKSAELVDEEANDLEKDEISSSEEISDSGAQSSSEKKEEIDKGDGEEES